HLGRHAILVAPPIDDAHALLVAAAAVPRRHAAAHVAPARRGERQRQLLLGALLGDLAEVGRGHQAAAGAGGLVALERHRLLPLEDGDGVALLEGDDRLLPVGPHPFRAADAPALAAHDGGLHAGDLHLEERLDGLLHFRLAGAHVDLERELVLAVAHAIQLLRVERALDDVEAVHERAPSSAFAPASVSTSAGWRRMS